MTHRLITIAIALGFGTVGVLTWMTVATVTTRIRRHVADARWQQWVTRQSSVWQGQR